MIVLSYKRLTKKIASLREIDFVRGVATLMRGNLAAQVILIGSSPLITRLFDPDAFGVFALFTAMVSVISKIGSLCYERAVVLPRHENDAYDVVVISFIILIVMVALSVLIAGMYAEQIAGVMGSKEEYAWVLLVPIGIFLMGVASIGRYWALRNKEFRMMSRARILDASVSTLIKVIIGIYAGSLAGGLIIGMLSGATVALMVFAWPFLKVCLASDYKPSVSRLRMAAKEYSTFPLYASWNALIDVLSMRMLIFFLSIFFTPAITGLYSLSNRIMRQPIEIFSQATASAYFQESARQAAEKRSTLAGLKKTTSVLAVSSLLPFILLALFGRDLFELVFGINWGDSGYYCEILSPWFFFLFISGPSKMLFDVYNRQKFKLVINITTGMLRLLAILIAYYFAGSVVAVIIVFAIVSSLMEVVIMIVSFRIAAHQALVAKGRQ